MGMRKLWIRFVIWIKNLFRKPNKALQRGVSLCLLFLGKTRRIQISLPENFDLERHKEQYPPQEYGFKHIAFRDFKALYILNLLAEIPARNSDLIREDGFVPIHTPTLRNHLKDCKYYIDYLVNTGVLVCDGQYIIGEKSMWYRWADPYISEAFHAIESEIGNYENSKRDNAEDRKNYPYLFYWYDQRKLRINLQAYDYAEKICKLKMQDDSHESWDWNRDKNCPKNPHTQYMAALRNIDLITEREYGTSIDENVHRLHSVLTNIQKDLRNFITYDGQPLVSIDIKNCQPYLSCLLLNPRFWQQGAELPLTLHNLPANIQALYQSPELIDRVKEFFETLDEKEVAEYIRLVSEGTIYEQIRDIANRNLQEGQSPIERKDAKILMFYMLFSSNQGQHDNPMINELKRVFSTLLYPKVAELFRIIKRNYPDCEMEKPNSRLSRALQSIESTIILHRCCLRIWEERKQSVPIFTIHDSIVTTREYQDYVYAIMTDEFIKHIGTAPKLSVEIWSEENVPKFS